MNYLAENMGYYPLVILLLSYNWMTLKGLKYMTFYGIALLLGIIILDNMLWGGEVLNPKTEEAETLNELNSIIYNDKRNINMLIPIRDGLMLCIKNE